MERLEVVNHDVNFKLKDGSMDLSYYIKDRIHLNPSGLMRLATNLGCQIKPGVKHIARRPTPPGGKKQENKKQSPKPTPPKKKAGAPKPKDPHQSNGNPPSQNVKGGQQQRGAQNHQGNGNPPPQKVSGGQQQRGAQTPPLNKPRKMQGPSPPKRQQHGVTRQQQQQPWWNTHQPPASQRMGGYQNHATPGNLHHGERQAPPNYGQAPYGLGVKCQLCGNVGHGAASCRSTKTPCYSCGDIGHLAKCCPQFKRS